MDMKLSVNAPKQKAALLGVVFITVIPYFSQYLQFIIIVRGSLLELETQLIIAKELDFVNQSKFDKMSDLIVEENKIINAFIRSVEKSN